MGASKKSLAANRYILSGSLKKKGISILRFVFNGIEKGTGVERKFFIELVMLNPWLSPSETVLGFKSRVNVSAEDLQNVLAGTVSAHEIKTEKFVIPSYVAIRVGILGVGAKQFCEYHIIKDLKFSQRSLDMELGRCAFTEDKISGMITYSPTEVREHPEYMSDDGSFEWDLRYDIRQDLFNGYNGREGHWSPTGIKTVFAGSVIVDGREYNVIPKSSFGYVDKFWGETLPESWIHLSASHLTSIITGRILEDSSFAIQGIFNDRLSLVLKIEDKEIVFSADSSKRSYTTVWDCSSIVSDDSGEKLHWSVSFHNKNYVVDVDVFCVTSNLFVRTWELPEGQRKVLKVLAGSSGVGELRVYKRIKKNLELIEHAHIPSSLCEFGQLEVPEN